MNRRTFVTGTAAAFALAPALSQIAAQDVTPEAHWDETSQLFGNAWDLLPKAEEGTIQLLNFSIGPSSGFGTRLLGIVHNATDEPQMLDKILCEEGEVGLLSTTHSVIQSGSYAFALGFAQFPLEEDDDVPNAEAVFVKPEDATGLNRYVVGSVPLQVDAVSFQMNTNNAYLQHRITATITNTSDVDPDEASPYGMYMFFDENGVPTAAHTISHSDPIPPGESAEAEDNIYLDFDPEQPFLVGYAYNP